MDKNDNISKELTAIKRLLVLQLYHQKIPPASIAKASGMSTETIYKFVPKGSISRNTRKKSKK